MIYDRGYVIGMFIVLMEDLVKDELLQVSLAWSKLNYYH